jgi:hypothetical protein
MKEKFLAVFLYALPVVVMIGLIPLVTNDYALTAIYSVFVIALLLFKNEKNDLLALAFGFIAVSISEFLFVSTGVETFARSSLLGVMPLWLPFLWAYVFVTIKRSLKILDR